MNDFSSSAKVSISSLSEINDYLRQHESSAADNAFYGSMFSVAVNCKVSMQALIDQKAPLRMDFMRVVLLNEGRSKPVLNFRKECMDEGDFLFVNHGVMVHPETEAPNLTFSGFMMTEEYVKHIFGKHVPAMFLQPGLHFKIRLDDETRHACMAYLSAVLGLLKLPNADADMVNSLFVSLLNITRSFYEKEVEQPKSRWMRGRQLADKFTELVQIHAKTHHDIDFYASKLCVTPHYLGVVVKHETGETAKTWIDKSVIMALQVELKYSDKTLERLSREFDFASTSALCKFFKRMMGITPNTYRNTGIHKMIKGGGEV